MDLLLDITNKRFTVGLPAQPKTDLNGVQKRDRQTGAPLNVVQLVMMDESGAEAIKVTVPGDPPQLQQGQPVIPDRLVAQPWAQLEQGRHGVAFRADSIRPAQAPASAKAS